jgi:large subunit ribosomal protein L17
MFRNMVTSLLKHDRIKTTGVKAKELRRWADHVITLAKRGDLHARRQAMSIVREKDVVHKLFEEAQSRFGHINGGYTRIVKIGNRPGDAAPVSLIELVSAKEKPEKKKKSKAPKKTKEVQPKEAATEAGIKEKETGSEQQEQSGRIDSKTGRSDDLPDEVKKTQAYDVEKSDVAESAETPQAADEAKDGSKDASDEKQMKTEDTPLTDQGEEQKEVKS